MTRLMNPITQYSSATLSIALILMSYQELIKSVHTIQEDKDLLFSVRSPAFRIITDTVSPTAVRILWKNPYYKSTNATLPAVILRMYKVSLFTHLEPSLPPGCNSGTEASVNCTPYYYRIIKGHPDRLPVTKTFASDHLAIPRVLKHVYNENTIFSEYSTDDEYNQLVFPQLRPGRKYNFIIEPVVREAIMILLKKKPPVNSSDTEYENPLNHDTHANQKLSYPTTTSNDLPTEINWVGIGSACTFREPGQLNINEIEPTSCLLVFDADTNCPPSDCGIVVQLLFRYTTSPYLLRLTKDAMLSNYPAIKEVHQVILGGSNYQQLYVNNITTFSFTHFAIDYQITDLSPNTVYYYSLLILYNTSFIYMQTSSRFTTPKGVPDPPDHLQITDNQDGSFKIEWAQPMNTGGIPIQSYILQYQLFSREQKGQKDSWHRIKIDHQEHHGNNNSFTLKLDKCTDCKLSIKVAANNSLGIGKFSKITSTNTGGTTGNRKGNVVITTILVIAGLAFLLIGATSIFCYRKKLKSAKEEIKAQLPPIILPKDLASLPKITSRQTKVLVKLGEGNFGTVYSGLAFGLNNGAMSGGKAQMVALKMLKKSATLEQRSEIVNEALTMRNLHHPNILGLLGLCSEDQQFWLVLEFMDSGNLCQYLKDLRPQGVIPSQVSLHDLGRMIKQVIAGAVYVESLGYTHRDLAARNILVNGRDPEQCQLKIADFGLTRGLYEAQYYRMSERSTIPVRWTAPEVFQTKIFDFKSDTWAFGILAWEIVSLGETPYYLFTESEVIKFVLDEGTENPPVNCGEALCQIMLDCWEHDSFKRKSLSEIFKVVENTIIDFNESELGKSDSCVSMHSPYSPNLIPVERKPSRKTATKHINKLPAEPTLNGQATDDFPHENGLSNPSPIQLTASIQKEIKYTEALQLRCIRNPAPADDQFNPSKHASSNFPGALQTTSLDFPLINDLSITQPDLESGESPALSDPLQSTLNGYTDPQQLNRPIPVANPLTPIDQDQTELQNCVFVNSKPGDDELLKLLNHNDQPEDIIQHSEAQTLSDSGKCNRNISSIDNATYMF